MDNNERTCPKRGVTEKQHSIGKTSAGSRRFRCTICKREYTPNPKKHEYTQSERKEALRLLLLGNSGRGVGKALCMNKSNAYRWAKEAQKRAYPMWISPDTKTDAFELDELYWYSGKRKGYKNGINTYIMTMISREPRQIVAYAVDNSIRAELIQKMVDDTTQADKYYTDGGTCYLGVDFIGRHERNIRDKSDTHNFEGSNSDMRHYIAGLRRKSRCFFRSLETLRAVLYVFVYAYNRFGDAKMRYMHKHTECKRVYLLNHMAFV